MRYRSLGKTGFEVSEIGYGAWGIGGSMWLGAKDEESIKALNRAIDLGLNFIDTALVYGDGHSESLVGGVVKKRTERLIVASKIPPKNRVWPARPGTPLRDAFPFAHIVECTERSLRNLGLDTIDVQQFHVWSDEWAGENEWRDAVSALKEQGKIRFFGLSLNDHQPDSALEVCSKGLVDSCQVIYNIFDQSPEDRLFPSAGKRKSASSFGFPSMRARSRGPSRRRRAFPTATFETATSGETGRARSSSGRRSSRPFSTARRRAWPSLPCASACTIPPYPR